MVGNKQAGSDGELEVVQLVPCPNCGKPLMVLPPNYPLYDVQCTGCSFRAQVKTNRTSPKPVIFGAGWDIIDKVTKSGFQIPPLLANFKWEENGVPHQKILFYPFIPKRNLKKRQLSEPHPRAGYWMFNYIGLDMLPHFILYEI